MYFVCACRFRLTGTGERDQFVSGNHYNHLVRPKTETRTKSDDYLVDKAISKPGICSGIVDADLGRILGGPDHTWLA